MTTTHPATGWIAGDDWQINATLLDEFGNPFDLGSQGTMIQWCLLNAAGQRALDETDVAITIVNAAAGQCAIKVPAAKTSPLPAGAYADAIRIVIGGITSTLSWGSISVIADPWIAPVTGRVSRTGAIDTQIDQLRRISSTIRGPRAMEKNTGE